MQVSQGTTLGQLSQILENDHYAIIMNESKKRDGMYKYICQLCIIAIKTISSPCPVRGEAIMSICGVVTSIDLLHYISSHQPQ